jgi:hypothetical protein
MRPSPSTPGAQIAASLRAERCELDRRQAEKVIHAMRGGQALRLSYEKPSPRWRLDNGKSVSGAVAKIICEDPRISGIGDALFNDARSQTYRYAG